MSLFLVGGGWDRANAALAIMPICIHCGQPTPYLYTVYQSAYNFRLEQCVNTFTAFVTKLMLNTASLVFLQRVRGSTRSTRYANAALGPDPPQKRCLQALAL